MRGLPLKKQMFVYVLKSFKDKKYYIGCTSNKEQRLLRHNNGLVKSTRYRRPFELVYFEKLESYKATRKREAELKKMKGGVQFKKLLKKGVRG